MYVYGRESRSCKNFTTTAHLANIVTSGQYANVSAATCLTANVSAVNAKHSKTIYTNRNK